MHATSTTKPEKLGTLPYVMAGMSFIPLIGIVFGLGAIVWGLATKKLGGKRLAAIGAGGIAVTVTLYSCLFYFGFVQRGGVYDDLRQKLAQSTINSLVPSIEFYKSQNGSYPASLDELKRSLPKDSFVSVFDPTAVNFAKPSFFFYERVGDDHYYLRGVGPDGMPFTSDDIVPQFPSSPKGKLGLLVERKDGS